MLESAQAGYGWDRSAVARAVTAIVDEPAFDVEHDGALRVATTAYRERAIDLHDCFLDAIARERKVRVLSFEADLRRLRNRRTTVGIGPGLDAAASIPFRAPLPAPGHKLSPGGGAARTPAT